MKTGYYVAGVTAAYRRALDLLERDEAAYRAALPALQNELRKVSHRDSNTGFYFGPPQPSSGAEGFSQTMEFSGRVLGMQDNCLLVEVKNRFHAGDTLEVLSPEGAHPFLVERIIRPDTGETVDFVSVAGQRVLLPVDFAAGEGDYLRGPNRNHRMDTGEKNHADH